MEDAYQEEAYQEEYYYEPEPKRGVSPWLIALIVVLVLIAVCCLCACVVFWLGGPAIGNVFSTMLEAMTPMP